MRALRRIQLVILSALAMVAPAIGLRVAANRWKGVQWGKEGWVGVYVYLDIHRDHPDAKHSIIIGEDTAIGDFSKIYTHDSLYNKVTCGREPVEFGRVVIGDHCNISPNSFLYDCEIGSHSIVAPHSVVVKSKFPAYSLIAGNPAKLVKSIEARVRGEC